MKRYSLIYLLKEQYQHVGFESHAEAEALLHQLLTNSKRKPIGIYDAKTELFEWAPSYKPNFDQASTEEQARRGNGIITIAQALRRRDSSWNPGDGFRRPSFFA
ncbi:hypothetical protein [Fibrella forsythiae]|uniref:Uncharacterized protein n=1 Tax=Fibrella forsythiae TaxID=2817061 RepID=A0ABS3JGM1_9BACT|nr:hypothetical protein [Fibrella forsythiae]MBO0949143.1 hypothetical protein [Fibrella forsythiae]